MKLSFGMIFSIILIIAFLVVAFYAIQKFVSFQKNIVYMQFLDDLQTDIDKIWKSTQGSQIQTYKVPSAIKSICFVNDEFYEMKVNYKKKYLEEKLDNLDIPKTLGGRQEFCINVVDSKIKLVLKKNYSEPLVTIMAHEE